jgi:hypothetical protein
MPVLLDLFGEKEETRDPRGLYHYCDRGEAYYWQRVDSEGTTSGPSIAFRWTVPPTDSESLQSVPGHGYQPAPPRSVLHEQHIDPPINT